MAGKQEQMFVKEEKYRGKYVAFQDFNNRDVVASGWNPGKLIDKVRKMGVSIPAIVFVPKHNAAYIY